MRPPIIIRPLAVFLKSPVAPLAVFLKSHYQPSESGPNIVSNVSNGKCPATPVSHILRRHVYSMRHLPRPGWCRRSLGSRHHPGPEKPAWEGARLCQAVNVVHVAALALRI
jgi:hypothetical protein